MAGRTRSPAPPITLPDSANYDLPNHPGVRATEGLRARRGRHPELVDVRGARAQHSRVPFLFGSLSAHHVIDAERHSGLFDSPFNFPTCRSRRFLPHEASLPTPQDDSVVGDAAGTVQP